MSQTGIFVGRGNGRLVTAVKNRFLNQPQQI